MLTREDLGAWIKRDWARRGWTVPDNERVGISMAEVVEASAERLKGIETPYVELWVDILDEFTSWLISLMHVVYSSRREGTRLTDFERSVVMVIMKVVADSTAIRHLVLLGYDTSARAILRSTCEYLEVLVALLDDPSLAAEFVKSDTPEGAKLFWEKHLRGDKIRKRMNRAWRRFFKEDPENEQAGLWFASWGAQFQRDLSGLLHPSFAGGMLTAIGAAGRGVGDDWLGVWGDRSNASVSTIFIYGAYFFPLVMLHHEFPFSGFDEHLGEVVAYNEQDEIHRHVKVGRHVLASLILSLSKDANHPHVFPEDDWSWMGETHVDSQS